MRKSPSKHILRKFRDVASLGFRGSRLKGSILIFMRSSCLVGRCSFGFFSQLQSSNPITTERYIPEPIPIKSFSRFLGSFEPIFDFFCGDCIKLRILSPQKKSKIGQNNPKNRRTLTFATTSKDVLLLPSTQSDSRIRS